MKKRKVFKKSFCVFLLLFVVLVVVGCKTTPPTLGYIQPSKEIIEAYKDRKSLQDFPYDGVYLDYEKDGGHTTKRVVFLYDPNGNPIYKGENVGVNVTGRILSNAGVFIGAGTLFASPLWGYLASKKGEGDRINISGGGGSSSSFATATSGP